MREKIGILGVGRMGMGLARIFAGCGLTVNIGSRSVDRAVEASAQILANLKAVEITGDDYRQTARNSDIVILAIPYAEVDPVLRALEPELKDTIVVDITNPFGAAPPGISGAEVHAPLLPDSASLVAAWKTTYFRYLVPENRGGALHDVFFCGEEDGAKARIADLISLTGFRPLDCGGLEAARALDLMVPLLGEIAQRNQTGPLFAWKFLP